MSVVWQYRGPLLFVSTEGRYSSSEIATALQEARADDRFRPKGFVVFEGILAGSQLSPEGVRSRVQLISSLPSMGFSSSCALIGRGKDCVRDAIAQEIARAVKARGVMLDVLSGEDDSVSWLVKRSPGQSRS